MIEKICKNCAIFCPLSPNYQSPDLIRDCSPQDTIEDMMEFLNLPRKQSLANCSRLTQKNNCAIMTPDYKIGILGAIPKLLSFHR
jgi:hypothetical protein